MKKNYSLLLGALITSALPSIANADFYAGVEAADKVINIKQNDKLRRLERQVTSIPEEPIGSDVSIEYLVDDIYKADNIGGSLFVGYKFKNNYSVEMGYFTSNGRYKDIDYGTRDIGKIDIDSLSIDIKKSVKLDPSDAWSFIGSFGVIYQKSTVTTKTVLRSQTCSSYPDLPCSSYWVAPGSQTKFYDTRLELGIGTRYDLDEKISLRSMVKFIPNDLSFISSTPYYISFGALYNF